MKFNPPKNPNYCATVIKIKNIIELENCDNVVATSVFGFQAIVKKGTQVGDMGIVFTAETSLTDQYCYENNLYRHSALNKNQAEKGYVEDNGRVKAVRFRGHVSNCMIMPLESLAYTGVKISDLQEGDEFDEVLGKEICYKYVVATKEYKGQEKKKTHSRVNPKHLPEHISTSSFFKYSDILNPNDEVVVTQKLHGTSIRIGNVIVERKKTWRDWLGKKIGAKIKDFEFDYVYGSRKVLKDINNPFQQHFYGVDIWTEAGKQLDGILPENYVVYGELIGWTGPDSEIQRDYNYGLLPGTNRLYIYRIAIVNGQGIVTDLSWDQVKEFCKLNGLNYVPELWKGKMKSLKVEKFIDTTYEGKFKEAIGLGEKAVKAGLVDEGICVRREGITPTILKAKSPKFFEHESKFLDLGEVDLESSQSE